MNNDKKCKIVRYYLLIQSCLSQLFGDLEFRNRTPYCGWMCDIPYMTGWVHDKKNTKFDIGERERERVETSRHVTQQARQQDANQFLFHSHRLLFF